MGPARATMLLIARERRFRYENHVYFTSLCCYGLTLDSELIRATIAFCRGERRSTSSASSPGRLDISVDRRGFSEAKILSTRAHADPLPRDPSDPLTSAPAKPLTRTPSDPLTKKQQSSSSTNPSQPRQRILRDRASRLAKMNSRNSAFFVASASMLNATEGVYIDTCSKLTVQTIIEAL